MTKAIMCECHDGGKHREVLGDRRYLRDGVLEEVTLSWP